MANLLKYVKKIINFNDKHDKLISILLGFYFLLLPFEEAFATPIGTLNSIIGIFLMIYVLIRYRKSSFSFNIFIVFMLIWMAYLAISSLWSYYIDWWFYFFKIYLGQFVFMFILTIVPFEKYNFNFIEKAAILTGIIVTAILVMFPDESTLAVHGRRTIKINGTELDPNILSAIMSLGALFTVKGIFNKKMVSVLINLFFLGVIAIGIFLTGSRGGLVGMLFSLFLFLLLEFKKKKNRKKVSLIFGALICVSIVAILFLPKELINRFSLENLLGLTENNPFYHTRFNIWGYAIESWKLKPLFGYGCGNFFRAIEITYRQCASHNMFILQLIEGGIVGLILFSVPLVWIAKKLIKTKNYDIVPIFIFVIFMGLTLDNIQNKYYWFGLFYSYMYILSSTNNKEIVNEEESK